MAVELQTRLAEAIKVSSKSREQICAKVGIHLNTLGTYINGKRPISLDHAYKIMEYIEIAPELLFSTHPIRRRLTGVAQIDNCIRAVISAMGDETDVAAHYFAPDYLCVSSDYSYHNRKDETEKSGTDYYDVKLTEHEKSFGVDRKTEHDSFAVRKKDGWRCAPKVIFADVISRHCVTIFIRSTWNMEIVTQWRDISTLYESFDHLFFSEPIGAIAYGEKEPLITRKVWTPMPNFQDTRWYED